MSILKCPVCGEALFAEDKIYKCGNNHTFDKGVSGYVNLLPYIRASVISGDSREMVLARRSFLSKGYYSALSDQINMQILSLIKNISSPALLDAGCGEGYYTSNLYIALSKSTKDFTLAGIDISKDSVKYASKQNGNISFAVASIFHLPVMDESVDIITNIFSPCSNDEFNRVLKSDGYLITVIPGKRHLFGLKEVVYDVPYENDEEGYPLPDFELFNQTVIHSIGVIDKNEDINNLFLMTPYFWKSPIDGSNRLKKLDNLETEIEFIISVYKKL